MRLPWQAARENRQLIEAQGAEIEALRAEISKKTDAELVLSEFKRAAQSFAPVPQSIPTGQKPLFPLYNFDNPLWFAQSQAPSKRPGNTVDIKTLRRLADTYDVLRACIQHIKRECEAVPFKFVAKDDKDKRPSTQAQIDAMNEFCTKKGGLGGPGKSRTEFEDAVFEDLMVIGAAAIFYHPRQNGLPYQVVNIDGSTIRPCVDAYGWPGPGEVAYEQWILGVRVMGFTRDELDYRGLPETVRTNTPYHMSPIELLVFVIESALRADQWNRSWLQDGNSSSMIISLGDKDAALTPDQAKSWAMMWDAMRSGNSAARQKTAWLPAGSSVVNDATRKDQDFQEFELWLLRRTCAIMGVQPASIGFAGEQYKVSQTDSMESTSWFGTQSYLNYRQSFYDDLCERFGFLDICAANITAREEQASERATRNSLLVGNIAIKTINEVRQDEGLDAVEGGDVLFLPMNMVPMEQALAEDPDPVAPAAITPPKEGAARSALAQWERKALNRMKKDGKADCAFESTDIPEFRVQFVSERLAGCAHGQAVKELFRNAAEIQEVEASEVHDWADRVRRELIAIGAAE